MCRPLGDLLMFGGCFLDLRLKAGASDLFLMPQPLDWGGDPPLDIEQYLDAIAAVLRRDL